MKVIQKRIEELKFAPYNPRKITKEEYEKLKRSIQKFGYVEPIVWNKRTKHVVGGNQRLKVLKDLGFTIVNVVEVDLSLDEEKALNLALNKISGEWDLEKLEDILQDLKLTELINFTGFELEEIDKIIGDVTKTEYTLKVDSLVYEPTGKKVKLKDCFDDSKYKELINEIENSSIPEDIKYFLKLAAGRFIDYNFKNIAEYYANAPKEIQELFEKLALVIIDFGDAIQNGFVEVRSELYELWKQEVEADDEEE